MRGPNFISSFLSGPIITSSFSSLSLPLRQRQIWTGKESMDRIKTCVCEREIGGDQEMYYSHHPIHSSLTILHLSPPLYFNMRFGEDGKR